MTTPSTLPQILEQVANRMIADFTGSALIGHRGAKGTVRESQLRLSFLDKYLPKTVDVVGSGEIVTADGQRSPQTDVLIVDPATPPLWADTDYRIVPAECVYATVEVKSMLSTDELERSWRNAEATKALPKTAFRPDGVITIGYNLFGRHWSYFPTMSYVFAYDSASLETIGQRFADLALAQPDSAMRIDGVFVLNKGCVLWGDETTGNAHAVWSEGANVLAYEGSPGQVLLMMIGVMSQILGQITPKTFDFLPYLGRSFGTMVQTWEGPGSAARTAARPRHQFE